MKLKLYVIILFSWVASIVNAQIIITTPYEFSVGISGGTAFSSVSFSPLIPQKKLIGPTFGVTGRMDMGKYVGLQLELNYTREGWDEYYDDTPDYKYSRYLDYLQLPFYSRVQFGGKNVKGFINAGPQIGYLLGESSSERSTPPENRRSEQHSMSVENKFEWGISGGAGIDIRTGIGHFLLEGRYLYSFGDIFSTKQKDTFSKASIQSIVAKVSYLIPLKK